MSPEEQLLIEQVANHAQRSERDFWFNSIRALQEGGLNKRDAKVLDGFANFMRVIFIKGNDRDGGAS